MADNFNTELKQIRKSRGLTQEQLANMVGVSAQAVSKWEISTLPDAALLPQIADALGVKIDELFGRKEEKLSLYQSALNAVRDVIDYSEGSETPYKESFNIMRDVCRAFSIGCCGSGEYHPIENTQWECPTDIFSQGTFESGFYQSRLPENLHYFLLMPEPREGYDKVLAYDEKMVELFAFLGSPNALRAMYFLQGRKSTMFFNEKTLVNELAISPECADKIISQLLKFRFIWQADLNKGNENKEKIYQYIVSCNLVPFITFTRTLLNLPKGFSYCTGYRDLPYFKNDTYKKKDHL